MMNNTALRAEAQSANNTHMVFTNGEHGKFYEAVLSSVNINLQEHSIRALPHQNKRTGAFGVPSLAHSLFPFL